MEKTQDSSKGTLKVSESVIGTITKTAASEVEGVERIPSRPFRVKSFFRMPADPADINVSMSEGVCVISLSIVVKSGYNALSVGEEIQERVKSAVQPMTGVTVAKVDVTVSDISFAEPDVSAAEE